jgi:ketosteroid isomerase-like protein
MFHSLRLRASVADDPPKERTMLKRSLITISLIFATAAFCVAQNANSNNQDSNTSTSSSRTRTVAPKPSPTPAKKSTKPAGTETAPAAGSQTQRPKSTPTPAGGQASPSGAVLAAFNSLLDGIRHADVKAVTNAYQNTPRLVLFNNNGTVTKGWEQLKQNREASYPEMKDVKLDVRDLHVTMLGRDAALITCLWTQSQTFRGVPESASGRMTIVFQKIGKDWKAIHLHTSPDKPDPSRVMPSEQTPSARPTP